MWYSARLSEQLSSDVRASLADLLQPARRHLVLVTAIGFLAVAVSAFPVERGRPNLLIALTVGATTALARWLLAKRSKAALTLWHVGMSVAIAMATAAFHIPEIAFCYALLPLTAVVTVGWAAGPVALGLLAVLVWFVHPLSPALRLPPGYGVAAVAGGAFTGLLGWTISHSLLTATQWSLQSYERARESLEEARHNRMELRQSQEDLIHVNQELARLSSRLKVLNQVAQEARQAKEEFVANVSHELRTPLNMIIGFSEMITRSPQLYAVDLPPALLADIGAIQRNSRHLAALVDDVLDLSQVEAGRMALTKSRVSVHELIDGAVEAVRALFESKGLSLETEVPHDFPQLFADSTRVRQVLINLLSNAGRFTDTGGVVVSAWHDHANAVISVTDTGPGIAQQDQPKLFQPFQQLDASLSRPHGGSGLGLSISKRFVELHGGRMTLESQVGIGTKITFTLPIEPGAAGGEHTGRVYRYNPYRQLNARTRRSAAPPPEVVPRYVLLEQGETLRSLFERYLDGIDIVAVKDVDSAISELESSPAQALIVNTHNGARALSRVDRLRALPYGTPTVTCWIPGPEEAAHRLGVVRYLIKPITAERLVSTLDSIGLSKGTILLVDDDEEALQLFTRMLSAPPYQYHILQALSGARALRLLKQRRPDAVLLDLIMPGVDGMEVLRRKNRDPEIRDIPVVVVTSRDPGGEPIMSETLTVSRSGGLSVSDLVACVQTLTEALTPVGQPAGRAQRGRPLGLPAS